MKVRILIFALLTYTASLAVAGTMPDSLSVMGKDSIFIFNPNVEVGEFYFEPADILEEGLLPLNPMVATDSPTYYIEKARAAIEKIRQLNNFITNLDEASKFELPVGISRTIGGVTYDLAIDAIRLKPVYAELDVFLQFEVPQNGMLLTFMARGIKLTNKGGIVGDAKLELVGDYAINMNGNKSQIVLKGSQSGGNTFVSIDCDGFRELGLDAEVKFSRDLIRPEKADGTQAEGHVTASFSTVLTSWNDLVVQLTLPAFQVNGLPGVSFSVDDAVFDFSDVRNAPNLQFPEGYESTQVLPGNANLWRGFFLRELVVKLPPEFKRRGGTERTTFRASNVIIDNMGFTGKLAGTDLITLQQGDMAGWAFSIEQLQVDLRANQLVNAGFSGKIVIPVAKDETPFEYSAIINTGGNYLFSVSPASDLEFDVFKAGKVEIYEASYLDIRVENGKFLPKANLHGRMSIAGKLSEGGQGVELANISFEDLQIQSVKPYIKVGNFSFGSEAAQQKMAGFPISIQDIALKNISDTEVGLDFTLKLNLVGEDAGSFAADAGLTVIGKLNTDEGKQRWRYKDIAVREIGVDIDGGAFKFNGRLVFYKNDVAYGDGFNGTVQAEFKPGIKVSATAIFGSVNGMRYWYADAMAELPSGIPIFTGVGIYGFGGGAYYRMKIDNDGLGSSLGRTASGVVYIPDARAGLGLKAVVSFGSHPKPEAFNGDVTFEIAFFQGGGVRYIAFGGNGYLVTPGLDLNMDKLKGNVSKLADKVSKVNDAVSGATRGLLEGDDAGGMTDIFGGIGEQAGKKGSLSAHVKISYDFENRVLHGNFEMYVNVAGGIIKGVGPGGRAGWAVLHFAPNEWYIYVGTPDDRIGISVGIGPIRANATSYFMVGTKILGSPPPPPEVSRILGGVDLDYMKDLNAIGGGGGFAFGAALNISTGDLSFLMFYARFDAGAGFDIMLKDYGDLRCKGSNDRIGINGWYANGQAYAYFEGSIGIRVKVFGVRQSVEILSIGAAAVLQAKLPNPFWLRGIVGGRFSVLNGLVKGDCKFQVTIGKECEIERDPNAVLEDMNMIAELTPANGESQVNVFNTPQALFNMPIEKAFEIYDEVNKKKRSFRIKLDHFKVLNGSQPLVGTIQWNDNKDVLGFNSYEILPPKKTLKLSAQVSYEELINGNWIVVKSNGQKITEVKEQSFTTGEAPDYIPYENIEYAYPVLGQLNFYKDETREGYIKLKKAQPYLFNPGAEWKQEGRYKADDGSSSRFNFQYTYSTNMVTYSIPSDLKAGKMYTIELLNVPAGTRKAIDRNVTQVASKVKIEGQQLDTEITSKKAEGSIEDLEEKSIFTSYARSSAHATFSAKINSFSNSHGGGIYMGPGIHQIIVTLYGSEQFEKLELGEQMGRDNALIRLYADAASNLWYSQEVHPLIYAGYPVGGELVLTRDRGTLDIPPLNAVFIRQPNSDDLFLKDEYVFSGWRASWPDVSALVYDLPYEMGNDYSNLRTEAANKSVSGNRAHLTALLTKSFPVLPMGRSYQVKLQYVLPGINKITTEKEFTFNYPLPTRLTSE